MRYEHGISFVDDDALEEGQDFMFVALADGGSRIFYRESAVTPKVLEDSWAAYRRLIDEEDGGDPDDGDREPVAPPVKTLTLVPDLSHDAAETLRRYAV